MATATETTAVETAVSIESFLPQFSGFYGSIWESIIDSNEEMEIDYYVNELGKDVEYDDFDIDYTTMHQDLAKSITNAVEHELKFLNLVESVEYQKLVSPRYYNFSNDSINVKLNFSDENIKTIKNVISENIEEWNEYLKKHFTSCSGFISSHANFTESSEWNLDNIFSENSNNIGWVLDFIMELDEINEMYYYDNVEHYASEYMTLKESE